MKKWDSTIVRRSASTIILQTDAASQVGYDATLFTPRGEFNIKGLWSVQEKRLKIHILEGIALVHALTRLINEIKFKRLRVAVDNQTLQGALLKGGSRKENLNKIVRSVFLILATNNVKLDCIEWIPSKMNHQADALSKNVQWKDPDWEISKGGWSRINQKFGKMDVDRMASKSNAKLPRFNSRFKETEAEAVDCMNQDWRGTLSFVHPPFAMILRILDLVVEQGVQAVLIAPNWKGASWMPLLRRLITTCLMLHASEFVPGKSLWVKPWQNSSWRMMAVLIDGKSRTKLYSMDTLAE
jgi:hypothetical protein